MTPPRPLVERVRDLAALRGGDRAHAGLAARREPQRGIAFKLPEFIAWYAERVAGAAGAGMVSAKKRAAVALANSGNLSFSKSKKPGEFNGRF